MTKRGWVERWVAFSFARPSWVLLAFAVLGALSAYLASHLAFRGSFVELLPRSAKEVQDLDFVSKKAGGDGYLVVQVTGGAPQALQDFARDAAPALERLPEVRHVEYRYDVDWFRSRSLLLLPKERLASLRADLAARIAYEKKVANPLYIDLADEAPPTFEELQAKYASGAPATEFIGSRDGRELYLFVKPTGFAGDLEYSTRLLTKVEESLRELTPTHPGIRTDYAGAYKIRLEEDAVMRRDLASASLVSALIAMALILLATRKGSALVVVGGPVLLGISVTFGVAQLTIGHLNVVTGFLVAILIGLGIEYGVHLCMRYWEERRLLDVRDALAAALRGTFAGALTSALTNAAAFFVLIFARFHAFAQFGFIAGIGVLLTVLAAYSVGPAVLAIAERVRPLRSPNALTATEEGARQCRRWPTAVLAGISVAVLAFAGFSAYVAPRLGFESDLRRLKGDSPATALDDHISEQLGVKITPALLWVKGEDEARAITALIRDSIARHGAQSAFQKAASLQDFVPTDVEQRLAEISRLRPLLDEVPKAMREGKRAADLRRLEAMLDVQPWTAEELPTGVRRRFDSQDGQGTFVLLFPRHSMYDTEQIERWARQIDEVFAAARRQGVSVRVLDGNLIAARIFALLRGDGPYILWSAAAVVFVMILVSLRSVKRALLVATPLFLGMTCLAGAMHLFGVRLNFINAVVLPNLLAIAVDNSVHLYHRYQEEGVGSLGHVVRHTGLAAVVATLSNGAGYGALLLANHQGLRSIGQLAVLGVTCTFLGTTVLFPALLALLERWKERQARKSADALGPEAVPLALPLGSVSDGLTAERRSA